MIKRRPAALAALAAAFAGAAVALWPSPPATDAPGPKRELLLLTSLPLMFGERFGLDSAGSPALRRLEQDHEVRPIAAADSASLAGARLLLMAHPRAQPAELLVELDRWVRGGGRVVLLADPKLDWPSRRPLGDSLRPPPWFADTGLLRHWGVVLDGPDPDGPASIETGGRSILAASPGRFRLVEKAPCELAARGFIARCRVGQGQAVLIADADFLNVEGEGALDGDTGENLDFLAGELAALGAD